MLDLTAQLWRRPRPSGYAGAIADSCNVYFYTVGDMMEIEEIDAAGEKALAFGQSTGSEIRMQKGIRISRE